MFLSLKHFMFSISFLLLFCLKLLYWLKRFKKKNSWMGNARKIKLCLYVKQMLCHTPAVYNVNYLLNKRKCLVNEVPLLSHLCCGESIFWKSPCVFSCHYLRCLTAPCCKDVVVSLSRCLFGKHLKSHPKLSLTSPKLLSRKYNLKV